MPQHWTGTVLVSIVTTLLALLLAELTVKPRLEARNRRIQAAHIARDKFSETVLTIFNCCAVINAWEQPPIGPRTRAQTRYDAEHTRALGRLNDATAYLIDHTHSYALGYPGLRGLRELAFKYAAVTRVVFLSDDPEPQKIETIEKMSLMVQDIYFARISRARLQNITYRQAELEAVVDSIVSRYEESDPESPEPPAQGTAS